MSAVQMLAVFSENKPGQLARMTRCLADANINVHWVGIADLEKFGVIRFVVDQAELAHRFLRDNGFTVSLVEILAVEVADKPGSLNAVACILSDAGISLRNCSGFVFNQRAILLLEVADLARAASVLSAKSLRLLTGEEMLKL